jgi:pseudouridine synthase
MGEFIRLQKILAQAGFGSRRSCETFILEGRVTVEGAVVSHLGTKADPETQVITLDGEKVAGPGKAGKRLHEQSTKVYYALNKPVGVLCTNQDPSGRPLAIQMIPEKRRLFCVGRLDLDTEGLLLLTNDGELTHLLTHPRFGVPKTYMAKVDGPVSGYQLAKLKKGVYLSDGRTQGTLVRVRKHGQHTSTLEITIQEGLNRQVRRMLAAVGLQCRSLRRVKIGPLSLGLLPTGAYRLLGRNEVAALNRAASSSAAPGRAPSSPLQGELEQDAADFEEAEQDTEHVSEPFAGEGVQETTEEPGEQDGEEERGSSQQSRERKGRDERPRSSERGPLDRRPDRSQRTNRDERRDGERRPYGKRSEDRGGRGPHGKRPDDRSRGEGRPYEKRSDHRERSASRPYQKPSDRQDRKERRPYQKPFDRQDRDVRRPHQKPFNRQDRDERRPQQKPFNHQDRDERRPQQKPFNRQDRDERRPQQKPFNRQDRDERRPQQKPFNRQDRDERRPQQKPFNRQDRDVRRPNPKPFDRQDRDDRRPRRPDDRERRDSRERRPFEGPREARSSQQRSGYRGRPQDRGYDRKPGPRGHGGQGTRPGQDRRDDRGRSQGGRGGQRRQD